MSVARRTVLVADDTLFFRKALSDLLAGEGWQVVEAADGLEAVERARASAADLDLLILDVEMPGRNGLEVLAELRGATGGLKTPAVVLSGRELSDEQRRTLEGLGVEEVLPKSVPLSELVQRIRRWLGPDL